MRDRAGCGRPLPTVDTARSEWVLTLTGKVVARTAETVNADLPTGEVELRIEEAAVQGQAQELPLPVFGDMDYPEETRLTYRFLDLRRERLHKNIMLRANIVTSLRRRMIDAGLHRIPDPDPDRLVAGRARATSWCRRAAIRASSMPCRRRRSSSSS